MTKKQRGAARMALEEARNRLAAVWFVGAGLMILLLVVQSILGKHEQLQEVWSWFVPNVVPSLSLMLGVIAADALASSDDLRLVKVPFFRLANGVSCFYIGLLALTILLEPWSARPGIELFTLSNYWLSPTQGLAVAAVGAVFATQERGAAERRDVPSET
jgi:hypothetical protein